MGPLITSITENVLVPWRPETSPGCGADSAYQINDTGTCYHGKAFNITFDLTSLNLVAPSDMIWGVSYNSTHYGKFPIGGPGGPYDSLNVGADGTGASVGTDPELAAVFWNTSFAGFYGDGGASGVGTFRRDYNNDPINGWGGYTPNLKLTAH